MNAPPSAAPGAPPSAAGPALAAVAAEAAKAARPRTVPAAAPAVPTVPEALQAPEPAPENDTVTPLANVGDIGWMNGTTREKSPIFDTKFFTPEVRLDVNYLQSLNHPIDHTIDGSTEEFRSSEFQLEQVSFGGDFHWNNVKARFLSMYGMFATTTPRNDASNQIGQWQLSEAYRYFSEANAGYHFDRCQDRLSDLRIRTGGKQERRHPVAQDGHAFLERGEHGAEKAEGDGDQQRAHQKAAAQRIHSGAQQWRNSIRHGTSHGVEQHCSTGWSLQA